MLEEKLNIGLSKDQYHTYFLSYGSVILNSRGNVAKVKEIFSFTRSLRTGLHSWFDKSFFPRWELPNGIFQ